MSISRRIPRPVCTRSTFGTSRINQYGVDPSVSPSGFKLTMVGITAISLARRLCVKSRCSPALMLRSRNRKRTSYRSQGIRWRMSRRALPTFNKSVESGTRISGRYGHEADDSQEKLTLCTLSSWTVCTYLRGVTSRQRHRREIREGSVSMSAA